MYLETRKEKDGWNSVVRVKVARTDADRRRHEFQAQNDELVCNRALML